MLIEAKRSQYIPLLNLFRVLFTCLISVNSQQSLGRKPEVCNGAGARYTVRTFGFVGARRLGGEGRTMGDQSRDGRENIPAGGTTHGDACAGSRGVIRIRPVMTITAEHTHKMAVDGNLINVLVKMLSEKAGSRAMLYTMTSLWCLMRNFQVSK
eukprot:1192674-Prorocentrum_minimum.AAC.3